MPARVRNALRTFATELFASDPPFTIDVDTHAVQLWTFLVSELELDPKNVNREWFMADANKTAVDAWLTAAEWNDILDGCTAIYRYLGLHSDAIPQSLRKEEFANRLNRSLNRNYSVYTMDDHGAVIEPGSAAAEAAVAEARAILKAREFNGPDRQYQSAVDAFRRQPSPDYEQTVAEALNAVEGTANIVNGTDGVGLKDSMRTVQRDHDLHPALVESVNRLFGFASNTSRHGRVGEPKVDRFTAEFCLHHSAATIVLLARLAGKDVNEP